MSALCCTAVILASPPSHSRSSLCLFPLLALISHIPCFLLFWWFFLCHCPYRNLWERAPMRYIFGNCRNENVFINILALIDNSILALLTSCFHSRFWEDQRLSDSLSLYWAVWFSSLKACGIFTLFLVFGNSQSCCLVCVYFHPFCWARQALSVRQLIFFSSGEFMWITSLFLWWLPFPSFFFFSSWNSIVWLLELLDWFCNILLLFSICFFGFTFLEIIWTLSSNPVTETSFLGCYLHASFVCMVSCSCFIDTILSSYCSKDVNGRG